MVAAVPALKELSYNLATILSNDGVFGSNITQKWTGNPEIISLVEAYASTH